MTAVAPKDERVEVTHHGFSVQRAAARRPAAMGQFRTHEGNKTFLEPWRERPSFASSLSARSAPRN